MVSNRDVKERIHQLKAKKALQEYAGDKAAADILECCIYELNMLLPENERVSTKPTLFLYPKTHGTSKKVLIV